MSLRFIYGRAGCGKTYLCLNELKTKIAGKAQNPLMLLVPEQYTFQAERDLIGMLNTGGILETEVLSFQRLAFRVFNEVGGITYPHIHPAGKNMILYRIMDKMKGSLRSFAKLAEQSGFVGTLSTLITEFKRYNITPESLNATADKLEPESPLANKLFDLSTIYGAFEKMLQERYRDADDDLTLAAQKLKYSSQYRDAEIWIDGFTDFTPQEYGIIQELMLQAKRVTITLTCDKLDDETSELDSFLSSKKAYRRLLSIAAENNIAFDKPVYLNQKPSYRFKDNRELYHLEQNYNAHPYQVYTQPTKRISLFSSVNIFAEIEAAARDILRLCRDEGFRYRDIAVVTRNLTGYDKLIEVIFNDYGVPCFLDRKLDIGNHPLVRLILSMLEIFTENWSYEAVFRYLKSGLTGIAAERIDRLENYVLACGIRGKRWTDSEDWHMVPELLPDERNLQHVQSSLKDINQIRYEMIKPLMEFRNKTKGRTTAKEFCTALFDFLCQLDIPEQMEKLVEAFRQSGELMLANEYSQVWNMVIELLDQMVEVMADETFGVERFLNMLAIGFGEYKIGLIPASLDQVLVGSVERSKSHAIKALFILGTNDGIFPASGGEEGILTDDERDSLISMGVEVAKNTRSKALDEHFLVYRTLTTPSDYLRISWPIADQEGKSLRPSIVISRMRKLFPAIQETSNILSASTNQEVMEQIASKQATFRYLTGALRQKADGHGILPVWEDVARWFIQQDEWKQPLQIAREAFQYRNLAHPVSEENMLKLYGEPVVTSVSRLERYTSCPFSFFVQYGLGARERKIFALKPPDVGTFLHAAIERFSKRMEEHHGNDLTRNSERLPENDAKPKDDSDHNELTRNSDWLTEDGDVPKDDSAHNELTRNSDQSSGSDVLPNVNSDQTKENDGQPMEVSYKTMEEGCVPMASDNLRKGDSVLGGSVSEGQNEPVTWRNFDRQWCEQTVSQIIDEMLHKMKGSGISSSKRFTALTMRLKRVVTRAVWLIAQHIRASSFNPIDYEVGFGEGEKYPPIEIELASGQRVRLFGRIDRIDALKTPEGQYLRIIDYKSGSKDFKLSNVYYGLQLQLITYLDAIWNHAAEGNVKTTLPGGVLYFRVDDPMIKADEKMTEEEIEKAIMKQLKMKGLLLADVKLIREMDKTIDGSSLIVPATLNKGDVIGKNSSVATMEQFKILSRYVQQLLKDLSTEMFMGTATIRPVKSKEGTACSNCSYLPVCQFDTAMKENTYRLLVEKDKDEIWKLMAEMFKKE